MDQRTRNFMTRHKALQVRDNFDRLYVSRKEGRRGLNSIEDSVDGWTRRLENYIKKSKKRLITATRNNIDNASINWKTITRGLRRLAVPQTPERKHQLTMVWKILKKVNNNNDNKNFVIQTDHLISAWRPYSTTTKKKKNLQNCGLCCPGWPQGKIERKWKEE